MFMFKFYIAALFTGIKRHVFFRAATTFEWDKAGIPTIPDTGEKVADLIISALNWVLSFVWETVIGGFIDMIRAFLYSMLVIPLLLVHIFGGAVDLFSGLQAFETEVKTIAPAAAFPDVPYNGFLRLDSLYLFDHWVEYDNGGGSQPEPTVAFNDFKDAMLQLWHGNGDTKSSTKSRVPESIKNNNGSYYLEQAISVYRNEPDMLWTEKGAKSKATDVHNYFKAYGGRDAHTRDLGLDFDEMTTAEFRDWYFRFFFYNSTEIERGIILVHPRDVYGDGTNYLYGGSFEYSGSRWNNDKPRDWDNGSTVYQRVRGFYTSEGYGERTPLTRGDEAMRYHKFLPDWGDNNQTIIRHAVIHNIYHWKGTFSTYRYYTYKLYTYYRASLLWEDFVQNMPGIVGDYSITNLYDWNRYTDTFQEIMRQNGINPGWGQMYEYVANSLRSGTPMSPKTETKRYTMLDLFFAQNAVSYAFWGVTLIAMALCIAFSIIAVVRSMGDLQQKRPLGQVVGSIGKAMLTFLLIPVMVIAAVNVSGVLLQQLDYTMAAASVGGLTGDTSSDGRNTSGFVTERFDVPKGIMLGAITLDSIRDPNPNRPLSPAQRREEFEKVKADIVSGRLAWANAGEVVKRVDVFKMYLLPSIVAAWFSAFIMIMILMIFIRRIFEMVMLYIVSPLFVAPMPLDEGQKFKAWKDAFIGKAISGFSSILMLRLFLMFVPMIWQSGIRFASDEFADVMLKVLFMLGGLYTVYKSHTMITGLVSQQAASAETESSTGLVGAYTVGVATSALQQTMTKMAGTVAGKPFDLADSHLDKLFKPGSGDRKSVV